MKTAAIRRRTAAKKEEHEKNICFHLFNGRHCHRLNSYHLTTNITIIFILKYRSEKILWLNCFKVIFFTNEIRSGSKHIFRSLNQVIPSGSCGKFIKEMNIQNRHFSGFQIPKQTGFFSVCDGNAATNVIFLMNFNLELFWILKIMVY